MARCVAFLRAVNVGGRTVRMDALRAAFEALGFGCVETFIASGNVLFDTGSRAFPALERKIEAHLHEVFGFEIHTFIRSAQQLTAIADHAPFGAAAQTGAATFVVGFLGTEPDAAQGPLVERFATPVDRFHLNGRELYWVSTVKQSDSTFTNAAFEKALRTRATFRSMSTVRKLVEKLAKR